MIDSWIGQAVGFTLWLQLQMNIRAVRWVKLWNLSKYISRARWSGENHTKINTKKIQCVAWVIGGSGVLCFYFPVPRHVLRFGRGSGVALLCKPCGSAKIMVNLYFCKLWCANFFLGGGGQLFFHFSHFTHSQVDDVPHNMRATFHSQKWVWMTWVYL